MSIKESAFKYAVIAVLILFFSWLFVQTASNLRVPTEITTDTSTDTAEFASVVPQETVSSYTIKRIQTKNTTTATEKTTRKEVVDRNSRQRLTTITKPHNSTRVYQTAAQQLRKTTLDKSYTFYAKSPVEQGERSQPSYDIYATGNTTESRTQAGNHIYERSGKTESLSLGVRTRFLLELESQSATRYSEEIHTSSTGQIHRYRFQLFDGQNNTIYTEHTTVSKLNNSTVSVPEWYSENAHINYQSDCSFESSSVQLKRTKTGELLVHNVSLVNATRVVVYNAIEPVTTRSRSGAVGDSVSGSIVSVGVVNKTCPPVLKNATVRLPSER